MKRWMVVLVVIVVTALAMVGGVALALDKSCAGGDCIGTRGDDLIRGSTNLDRIVGMEGNDQILDAGGNDELYGDEGNDIITDDGTNLDFDTIYGDEGNDTINVYEFGVAGADTVNCGPGRKDKVFFDRGIDVVANNCEIRKP
jgi:Ca2+-binding RTX toxin-like protein